jgi:PPK2 family polyphosphate:nucleotide phosphotransferase
VLHRDGSTATVRRVPTRPPSLDQLHWYVDPDDPVRLSSIDPGSTPEAPGERSATEKATAALKVRLSALQNRLRAEEQRSVLLVLQGMDASGKDGTAKAIFSAVNPMNVRAVSFNVPTEDELAHDFLWRVHKEVPPRGFIGIFNRSHYEDILAVRVRKIAPDRVWKARYEAIRQFEHQLALGGTTTIKIMLHISKDEQAVRLQERLDDPAKRWKFRMGDLEDRKLWPAYQRAYQDVLNETTTAQSPWFVVPADRKWYRNFAVLSILVATLEQMNPKLPNRDDLDGVVVDCASQGIDDDDSNDKDKEDSKDTDQ